MKVSLNMVKEFTPVNLSVDELIAKIGAQLGGVEEVIDLGKKYQGIIVVRIVACEKHPDADKLKVCIIDDGGVMPDIDRDENGHVQIVCGAPEVHEGMMVAWITPGAVVPVTYDKEPLRLEAREIRGVISQGMLATPKELAISDDHSGLLVVEETAEPGASFAELYKLDDHIIDIENKMFTHRPDLFGILGVAREIAGIQRQPFASPDWYINENSLNVGFDEGVRGLSIDDSEIPELCPRYMAIVLCDVKVMASPLWLQAKLTRVGIRPVNNIVDMTNYMMMMTAQPLHAFDFDKVAVNGKASLVVRKPKKDEKITLLDGKTIEPHKDAILICDQEKPIALGGVMGANNSEIDDHTTRIIIECANFDMYNIRKTAMKHGLFTDAVTRFNKGQSPAQCAPVLYRAVQMMIEISPTAQPIGKPVDTSYPYKQNEPVDVTKDFINVRLGLKLSAEEMAQLLKNVEFQVELYHDNLRVLAPFWRKDIEIPEDIVEEVGRLHGYDHLPLELPRRSIVPAQKNALIELKSDIRELLAKSGANELLTYSFVPGQLLDKVGQLKELAFQLSNALRPELQYYRLSLTPSLLNTVHSNVKAGYEEFALFEIGKAHCKNEMDNTEPDVPKEVNSLSLVVASDGKAAESIGGAAYYQARKYLDTIVNHFSVGSLISLEPLAGADLYSNPWIEQMVAPFEPGRSAILRDTVGVFPDTKGLIWGVIGEYKQSVCRALKLPDFAAGFELDPLLLITSRPTSYRSLPRFPKVQQDVSLRVPAGLSYAAVYSFISARLEEFKIDQTLFSLDPIDIYQSPGEPDHRHITFRLSVASFVRTLTAQEINSLLESVAQKAQTEIGAQRL